MPEERAERRRSTDNAVVLKYWQVFFITLVQLAGLAYAYGRLSQEVENTKVQLSDLQTRLEEEKSVSRDEFTDFREEIRAAVRDLHNTILAVK